MQLHSKSLLCASRCIKFSTLPLPDQVAPAALPLPPPLNLPLVININMLLSLFFKNISHVTARFFSSSKNFDDHLGVAASPPPYRLSSLWSAYPMKVKGHLSLLIDYWSPEPENGQHSYGYGKLRVRGVQIRCGPSNLLRCGQFVVQNVPAISSFFRHKHKLTRGSYLQKYSLPYASKMRNRRQIEFEGGNVQQVDAYDRVPFWTSYGSVHSCTMVLWVLCFLCGARVGWMLC